MSDELREPAKWRDLPTPCPIDEHIVTLETPCYECPFYGGSSGLHMRAKGNEGDPDYQPAVHYDRVLCKWPWIAGQRYDRDRPIPSAFIDAFSGR